MPQYVDKNEYWSAFQYVYLTNMFDHKFWTHRNDRIPRTLSRKIGIASDVHKRFKSLTGSGDAHHKLIKSWHRPKDAAAVEWVAKVLLWDGVGELKEYVSTSAQDCMAIIEKSIGIVEAKNLSWLGNRKVPVHITNLLGMGAIGEPAERKASNRGRAGRLPKRVLTDAERLKARAEWFRAYDDNEARVQAVLKAIGEPFDYHFGYRLFGKPSAKP